jgi:hypothetical protein
LNCSTAVLQAGPVALARPILLPGLEVPRLPAVEPLAGVSIRLHAACRSLSRTSEHTPASELSRLGLNKLHPFDHSAQAKLLALCTTRGFDPADEGFTNWESQNRPAAVGAPKTPRPTARPISNSTGSCCTHPQPGSHQLGVHPLGSCQRGGPSAHR